MFSKIIIKNGDREDVRYPDKKGRWIMDLSDFATYKYNKRKKEWNLITPIIRIYGIIETRIGVRRVDLKKGELKI